MLKRFLLPSLACIAMLAPAAPIARAQGVADLRLFEQHCTNCHGNPAGPANAPDGLKLRRMAPEAVYAALAKAPHLQLQGLKDEDKRLIAGYLGGRKPDVAQIADAKRMPNQCRANGSASAPIENLAAAPMWNGWGADLANSRFQPAKAAGISLSRFRNSS
jgi:polyvinyl alcohol dehydrogenase (cytochrome)